MMSPHASGSAMFRMKSSNPLFKSSTSTSFMQSMPNFCTVGATGVSRVDAELNHIPQSPHDFEGISSGRFFPPSSSNLPRVPPHLIFKASPGFAPKSGSTSSVMRSPAFPAIPPTVGGTPKLNAASVYGNMPSMSLYSVAPTSSYPSFKATPNKIGRNEASIFSNISQLQNSSQRSPYVNSTSSASSSSSSSLPPLPASLAAASLPPPQLKGFIKSPSSDRGASRENLSSLAGSSSSSSSTRSSFEDDSHVRIRKSVDDHGYLRAPASAANRVASFATSRGVRRGTNVRDPIAAVAAAAHNSVIPQHLHLHPPTIPQPAAPSSFFASYNGLPSATFSPSFSSSSSSSKMQTDTAPLGKADVY